jgi:hypothetical protein
MGLSITESEAATFLRSVKLHSIEAEREFHLSSVTTFRPEMPSSAAQRQKAGQNKEEILRANADRKAALHAQRQKKTQEDELHPKVRYWHPIPRRCVLVKDMFDDVKDPLRKRPEK